MAHVSLITLGVADLARTTAFYEAIGWEPSSASVEGVVTFLRGGTVALGLYGREALGEDARVELPGPPGAVTLAMNLPTPADVDDALATAEDAGARITKPAEPTDWGGYSGYFADPEGHLWEVAHNPGFPLDDDGRVRLP